MGYWSIRGLAAPLRMMIMYAGTPLKNEMYNAKPNSDGSWDTSDWFSQKPALKLKNPSMNLPFIVDGDVVVS